MSQLPVFPSRCPDRRTGGNLQRNVVRSGVIARRSAGDVPLSIQMSRYRLRLARTGHADEERWKTEKGLNGPHNITPLEVIYSQVGYGRRRRLTTLFRTFWWLLKNFFSKSRTLNLLETEVTCQIAGFYSAGLDPIWVWMISSRPSI